MEGRGGGEPTHAAWQWVRMPPPAGWTHVPCCCWGHGHVPWWVVVSPPACKDAWGEGLKPAAHQQTQQSNKSHTHPGTGTAWLWHPRPRCCAAHLQGAVAGYCGRQQAEPCDGARERPFQVNLRASTPGATGKLSSLVGCVSVLHARPRRDGRSTSCTGPCSTLPRAPRASPAHTPCWGGSHPRRPTLGLSGLPLPLPRSPEPALPSGRWRAGQAACCSPPACNPQAAITYSRCRGLDPSPGHRPSGRPAHMSEAHVRVGGAVVRLRTHPAPRWTHHDVLVHEDRQ